MLIEADFTIQSSNYSEGIKQIVTSIAISELVEINFNNNMKA